MKNFAQNWLDIQSKSIEGLYSALFLLLDPETKALKPAAQWPVDNAAALELVAVSKLAIQRKESVVNSNVSQGRDDSQMFDYLATPVIIDEQFIGIVAVKTTQQNEQQQNKTLNALSVGTKWLAMAQSTEQVSDDFYVTVVRLSVNCLQQPSLKKAYSVLINEFTREYHCDRVAIGELKHHHTQVIALSNSARFDDRSNLIRAISAAMDESVDQDKVTVYPPIEQEQTAITYAHADLARKYGNGAICTIPLVYNESVFAVLTMERPENKPFDQLTINACEQILGLISPFLKLKQDDELLFIQKASNSVENFVAELIGFQYIGLKLLLIAMIAFISFAMVTESDFRIHADAVLEGKIQRVVSAPIDGFISSANVRAGDTVLKQGVMATMDDVDLKLEKIKLSAEQQQVKREYREAMANRDLVQVRVLNAQLAQIEAKINLKNEQLQRTVIQAPFDGLVIEGDLSQSLGAPVDRGDSLFTIAPLDGYRVILKVNERSISHIRHGQKGVLALSSLADRKFPLTIEKITEVANTEDGSNVFRVEAALSDLPKILRPGMEGVGKIEIGRKKLFWIWTHELVDWVKLWVWSWLP